MPPDDKNPSTGIRGDRIPKAARQNLPPEGVGVFLDAIFANVAVKPKPVTLGEGARVVRYLKATAWSSRGPERQALERLAESVAQTVFKFAPIGMASKDQALRFLERHAETYLSHPQLDATLDFVRRSPGPQAGVDFFPQPKLASSRNAVFGSGTPRIGDDLSERIYAAYHALRRARVHGARTLVAEALNRHGIRSSFLDDRRKAWGPDEVWERVKQYGIRLKRNHRLARPNGASHQSDFVVDKWISSLRG